MTEIIRPDVNIQGFASGAQAQERTTFGTENESNNLADYLTPEFLRGWGVLPVGGKPFREWFNGALFTVSQLQALQFQQGIPEYAPSQEFHENSLTRKNGVTYRSKSNDNTGNDPETDSTNWQPETGNVPGTKNVSEIIDNDPEFILPITPDDGQYITLTGHGSADYTITGFGDACPVGYKFTLLIPRTIADTGGTANALGNFVQFQHSASGGGIDLTINKRMDSGSALYTAQAYPNINDAVGNACNLYEEYEFICEDQSGNGRWRCVKLPNNSSGSNQNGDYQLYYSGISVLSKRIVGTFSAVTTDYSVSSGTANGNYFNSLQFPLPIEVSGSRHPSFDLVEMDDSQGSSIIGVADTFGTDFLSAILTNVNSASAPNNTTSIAGSFELVGRWKPNV